MLLLFWILLFFLKTIHVILISSTAERACDLICWVQKHVDVRVHVDFQILGFALPPGSLWKNSGFPVKHLTLSCCLPLVCRFKETAAPSFSFPQVTIVMRVRKAPTVGLDLNYVAAEGQSSKVVGFHCQMLEKLPVEDKIHLDLKKEKKITSSETRGKKEA